MDCYACEKEAASRCPRCGSSYCAEHGEALCAACLEPASGAPSGAAFRLSLFGLLTGSVLALWLLIRPPSLPGETSEAGVVTASPIATALATAPAGSAAPSASAAPTAAPATAAPAAASAPQPQTYTVQEGDTLSGIAQAYGVSSADIITVNGLADGDDIHPGDVLAIPQ